MRPVLLALVVVLAAAAGAVRAVDPAAAASGAATIAAPSAIPLPTSATATAAVKPLQQPQQQPEQAQPLKPKQTQQQQKQQQQQHPAPRHGPVVSSAYPAPHYANYSLASSRDTFEICMNQSGLAREIGMEELLPIYGLPRELLAHRRVSLAALTSVLARAAPAARLVITPLLAGEAELSPVLHPDGRLPRLVHFTVRDKDAMLPHQALSIATWARLNPGYAILLYDDSDISAFMATYHPRLLPLFHRLGSQVERTDLWRYLVLCTFGGVYADSDVVAGRPVSTWAQDAGLLTGVENVFETMAAARKRDYTRKMQIVQWAIAARPGHPVVCRMGDYIQRRVNAEAAGTVSEEDRDHAILERTGPGIWSSSVHDYLREHGVVPESLVGGGKVGDVRILPQSTFGCASSTVNLTDPMAYVYHMFKGSWRLHEPGKLWQFISHLYSHLFSSQRTPAAAAPTSPAVAGKQQQQPQQQQEQQQKQQQQGQEAAPVGAGRPTSGGAGPQVLVERRLREQVQPAAAPAVAFDKLLVAPSPMEEAPQSPAHGLHLVPLGSGAILAVLVLSAMAQRSSRCGGAGSGGRCGGLRSSATGALTRLWGGAKRLAARSGAGTAPGGSASMLLPLSQQSPRGGGGSSSALLQGGGGTAVVAAASTRPPGSTACLKRSGNSTQCLNAGLQQ